MVNGRGRQGVYGCQYGHGCQDGPSACSRCVLDVSCIVLSSKCLMWRSLSLSVTEGRGIVLPGQLKRDLELLISEVFPELLGNPPQVGERDLARLIIVKEFECLKSSPLILV